MAQEHAQQQQRLRRGCSHARHDPGPRLEGPEWPGAHLRPRRLRRVHRRRDARRVRPAFLTAMTSATDLSGAVWRRSSRSAGDNDYVEVADNLPGIVALRDSRNPDGPALVFNLREWEAFVGGAKDGEFDL